MSVLRPNTARMLGLLPASLLSAGLLSASPVLAQTATTRSETATAGKSVRILVASNLKKDCSAGPTPELRISGSPKNGSLITKTGKLKTPASHRCPNKETAVQAVFYQSKAGFTGSDEVTVEVKNADGQVQTQTVKITVGAGDAKSGDQKAGEAKKEGADL